MRILSRRLHSLRPAQAAATTPRSPKPLPPGLRQACPVTSSAVEDVKVPCGSSGAITLNLHHPLRAAQRGQDGPAVVVYLPRGPLVSGGLSEDAFVPQLSRSLPGTTLVRVNYRWDGQHRFPTAVHDTLVAYDWVLDNLVATPSDVEADEVPRGRPTRFHIGVCGELVGGGLATMLALTECHAGRPSIAAAAVNNPMLDWTFGLDEPTPTDKTTAVSQGGQPKKRSPRTKAQRSSWSRSTANSILSAEGLSYTRDNLFRKPGSYFDPFASPLLFFRTAGVDLPTDEDDDESSFLDLVEHEAATSPSPSADPAVKAPRPPRRATAHRRYPPPGMGLRLPHMRISVGRENILHDQGSELASLMRRSILMNELKVGSLPADETLMMMTESSMSPASDEAVLVGECKRDKQDTSPTLHRGEERIQLVRHDGPALWCSPDQTPESSSSSSAAADLDEVGKWFQQIFLRAA